MGKRYGAPIIKTGSSGPTSTVKADNGLMPSTSGVATKAEKRYSMNKKKALTK